MSTNKRRKVKAKTSQASCDVPYFDAISGCTKYCQETHPVWQLPRTAEDYDAMVEQMARAQMKVEWPAVNRMWQLVSENTRDLWRHSARIALRAIGITRPPQNKEGK